MAKSRGQLVSGYAVLCCAIQPPFSPRQRPTRRHLEAVFPLSISPSLLHRFKLELQQLKMQVELDAEIGKFSLPARNSTPFHPRFTNTTHKQTRNQNRGVSSAQLPPLYRFTPLLQLGKFSRQ